MYLNNFMAYIIDNINNLEEHTDLQEDLLIIQYFVQMPPVIP